MIKLTIKGGVAAIYVNPENVVGVYEISNGTNVSCRGDGFIVTESPEEIVRKIMDYKLAMVRYTTSSQIAYDCYSKNKQNPYTPPLDQILILDKLAGLEQTP